jgi:beta-galactosidase beta subunit
MIIDTLSNAEKYSCVHALFAKAFEYIKSVNLNTIQEGDYEISNGLRAIVSNRYGKTLS